MERHYYSFNEYLQSKFGMRVQRLSLNAGFNCPNRDGLLSSEGCIFCNEEGFANFPQATISLDEQIRRSMDYFKTRFKAKKFIAYFQNSTNTYADIADLKKAYDVVNAYPDIVGLFVSTRPDCIDEEKLDLIDSYADKYDTWVEYGLQSVHNKTLRGINRSHTFEQFLDAVKMTQKKRIRVSAHIILGLPGESEGDMIETAKTISRLPISGVKIHALHVLRDTRLALYYEEGKARLLAPDEYVGLVCDFLEHLNPNFVIMRLVSNAKDDLLIAPKWINEKQRILSDIDIEFKRRGTYQGKRYDIKDGRTAGVA
jgi:radical SAM protein (TIGR01212 family)